MTNTTRDRWGAACGFVAFTLGALGGALERGWPGADQPAAVAAFVAAHRGAILGQSMAFALSAGVYLWFFESLRRLLAQSYPAGPSNVVLVAGSTWAGLQMLAQAFQIGAALTPAGQMPPALLWTMAAVFSVSNLPLAVAVGTTTVIALRAATFPIWLSGLGVATTLALLLLFVGTTVRTGPLAPGGWLGYVLYPIQGAWLLATAIVMAWFVPRRIGN